MASPLAAETDSKQASSVLHWSASRTPIYVYIENPSAFTPHSQAVWEAFRRWETILQKQFPLETLQFIQTPQKTLADIEIAWSPTPIPSQIAEFANATCEKQIRGNHEIFHARILLGTQNPYTHQQFSNKQIQQLAVHEIGHVLGLNHSQDPNDVMYPGLTENSPLSPSPRDIQILRFIYREAAQPNLQNFPLATSNNFNLRQVQAQESSK